MNIFINIDVLAFVAILPFGQKLTDFILTKRTSTPGSSTHYIRSRSTFPVVLFHWAFYSGFSWRAAYHSYVIVIPTMLSLCIFYGSGILLIKRWSYHRQPKRTMCGFGLQRSFGRNILELLVYYLMRNKCKKVLKIWSLLVCLPVLVALKIMKVDISCIITCDSGPYCSNFITCTRIYNAKKKKIMITRNIDSKSSLTFSS